MYLLTEWEVRTGKYLAWGQDQESNIFRQPSHSVNKHFIIIMTTVLAGLDVIIILGGCKCNSRYFHMHFKTAMQWYLEAGKVQKILNHKVSHDVELHHTLFYMVIVQIALKMQTLCQVCTYSVCFNYFVVTARGISWHLYFLLMFYLEIYSMIHSCPSM